MAIHTSVSSFNKSIDKWMKKTAPNAVKITITKVLLSTWQAVMSGSPVNDGVFRSNWVLMVDELSNMQDWSLKGSGAKSRSFGLNRLPDIKEFDIGDFFVISNALPYSYALEGGHSKQAPQGIIGPAKRAVEAKIRQGVK